MVVEVTLPNYKFVNNHKNWEKIKYILNEFKDKQVTLFSDFIVKY